MNRTEPAVPVPRARRRTTWAKAAGVAFALVCLSYAPIAATELWPYAHPGAPAWGEWALARAVNPHYVAQAFATRVAPYRHSLVPLLVHTVLGAVLMLLGPLQLLSAVRRRIRLHRTLGVVFAATVYASMGGAAVYLVRTRPEDAFSGAAFWIVLATILLGTVLSATYGILAAVTGRPDLHQRWMLLCYGFLMTAPLLRVEWAVLPLLLPGQPMAEVNRVAIMHLGTLVAFGALCASRAFDRRSRVAGVGGSWVPRPVLALLQAAGAGALVWIGYSFAQHGSSGHRMLVGYLLPYAAVYAVLVLRMRSAARAGRPWAAEEWRLHLAALCAAPAFSVGAVLVFRQALGLDELTALSAGVAIGGGMLAFAATTVVSLRVLRGRVVLERGRGGASGSAGGPAGRGDGTIRESAA
ncbi:DUF2306 domain-containing protein [Streptacidiphilus monticola]|uniref:DUF2306 domain-containing protein n=1 Tax=Streptacidiphilus monticola TaxID=2161674 RepID=A0ABW1GBK8_9ACTN